VSELNPKPSLPVHVGATTALACWLAALLAFALHLDNPWWAAISAWVVANPERQALLDKAGNRILGTVVGCVMSYWLTTWVESRPLLQVAAMCLIAGVGIYGRFRSQQSYAWIIGAVGALAILSTSLETPGEIFQIAVFRACEVICGVIAVTFVELLVYRTRPPVDAEPGPAKKANAPTMDRSSALRLATIGGVSMIVILILWLWLNLPSLPQIVITCLVVLDRDGASTHFRGLQRILGCLAGGACGLLTVSLGPDSFLIWSVILIGGVFLFSLIHHGGSRWAYVGTQGGVAFILALVTGPGPPDSIVPAVNRIAGMLCGVGILLGICFVFEQMRENHAQLQRANSSNTTLLG
jgi:uncharacterized membrane protein YccC